MGRSSWLQLGRRAWGHNSSLPRGLVVFTWMTHCNYVPLPSTTQTSSEGQFMSSRLFELLGIYCGNLSPLPASTWVELSFQEKTPIPSCTAGDVEVCTSAVCLHWLDYTIWSTKSSTTLFRPLAVVCAFRLGVELIFPLMAISTQAHEPGHNNLLYYTTIFIIVPSVVVRASFDGGWSLINIT
jgi:hypothetical protein